MAEHISASELQTCVVGCGECGSRIAAYFDKMPSFLQHRVWHLYPVRCAAIDTDPSIERSLPMQWDWQQKEDIHIIPLASFDAVCRRILGKPSGEGIEKIYERMKSGAGGFPYMGTLTAEAHLIGDSAVRGGLKKDFEERGFVKGALLVTNSLTGGTGTGLAPAIPEFFSNFFAFPRITINLSIVPQLNLLQQGKRTYPANIIYGLSQLSRSKRVDAVILADNDVLSKQYRCRGNPEYNSLLHEALTSILLAPLGEYGHPSFRKTLDFADIQRVLRPLRGFGRNELCALSLASKKPPKRLCLRLKSPKRRPLYINKWLRDLVDSAISKTTVGALKTEIQGAVGVLSGPPHFFDQILEGYEEYYYNMLQYANEKIGSNVLLAFLQFPKMKEVRLSLILSGITSDKLEKIYQDVVPPAEQKKEGSLMERIRQLNPKTVEDLMIKEIREQLSREVPLEGESEG